MITPADSVIITITGRGYTIEAYADRSAIASEAVEITEGEITKYGDDLFEELPVELASTLDGMQLYLTDAVLAMMPEAA